MRLFGYAPQNGAAAGDTMPFWHEGRWHLFFSQPPRDAWEYVERARVSTAHLVSDDLVNWEVLPDSFGPGVDGSCDGNGIWTGSLIEHEGIFHFFYTGYNRHADSPQSSKAQHRPHPLGEDRAQSAFWPRPALVRERGLARSLRLARPGAGSLHDADLRAAEGWPALPARLCRGGRIEDLENWEVCAPFATPMLTHCPECPELFQLGDWWYLLRSRYDGQAQTFYRVAPTPRGPWSARRLDTLDGRRFYAAKSAGDGRRRFSFAWIPYRKHHEASGD